MKIARIKALCKEAKKCIIYEGGRRQWIGTTDAAYPADNLTLDEKSIGTLFDMPGAIDALRVGRKRLEESDIAPEEATALRGVYGLRALRESITLNYLEETLLSLVEDSLGMILFVRADYVRAAESKEGYLRFGLAQNVRGEPLIVMDDGLITVGLVKPIPKRTAQSILRIMEGLAQLRADGTPNPEDAQKQKNDELQGQMHMDDMMEEGAKVDADHD